MRIGFIIPALDEQSAVAEVIGGCLEHGSGLGAPRVVVCDNGSTDDTANVARAAGAEVVFEPQRGYGAACLRGIEHLRDWAEVLVIVDGDGSSDPADIPRLVRPLICNQADLVIGAREEHEPGSMTPPQRFGNWLACTLIRWRWGKRYRDCGPLRAVRRAALEQLNMQDRTWGWNVEMQIKAILCGLMIQEVPVRWCARRAGRSKISGSLSGVLRAGSKILYTVAAYATKRQATHRCDRDLVMAFVKYPHPGQVKTRLAESVGDQQAAQIYAELAQLTHGELMTLQRNDRVHVALAVDGEDTSAFEDWLPGARYYWPQPSGDLGARLRHAFQVAFDRGAPRVAAVGTDCPQLDHEIVLEALAALGAADISVVPSTDGGYALIALKRYDAQLFQDISWSTDLVLEQTLQRAESLGLSTARLPALVDVDTAEDLDHIQVQGCLEAYRQGCAAEHHNSAVRHRPQPIERSQ